LGQGWAAHSRYASGLEELADEPVRRPVGEADLAAAPAYTQQLGQMLARGIPGARFVEIDSRNHVPMPHEAAWQPFIEEICAFTANRAGRSAAR
jgi:hypothetical protein